MNKELASRLIAVKEIVTKAIQNLKLGELEIELDFLESESNKPNFWDDQTHAKNTNEKINSLKEVVAPWRRLEKEASELFELLEAAAADQKMTEEIAVKTTELEAELNIREVEAYLSGKFDKYNAVLSIYAGAGGVDAQDWAEMLLSMYLKYAQRKKFQASIIQLSPGTEAGLKSVTVEIKGPLAYGLLKSERGVHRLVRISPYDSDKARHTSFALVELIPEFEDVSLNIPDTDLKIETYRASGHGGQSVNTTDSAVRITHIPTKTVVTCQNERSQLQNRETAMKILLSRLQTIMESEREKELRIIKGDSLSAEWGSQIRSYVLHPYQMVKDHRTLYETSDTQGTLNGNLDGFIDGYLKGNPES